MRQLSLLAFASLLAWGPAQAQEERLDPAKDAPPRLLKQAKPKYPREAFARGTEGVVLLEFVIDEEGKVQSLRVLESVSGLDEAAIEAIKKWKFSPALSNGKRVRTTAKSPVTFCIYQGCKPPRGKPVEK